MKLKKTTDAYIKLVDSGGMTRARTTRYNARKTNIMEFEIVPFESELKAFIQLPIGNLT